VHTNQHIYCYQTVFDVNFISRCRMYCWILYQFNVWIACFIASRYVFCSSK